MKIEIFKISALLMALLAMFVSCTREDDYISQMLDSGDDVFISFISDPMQKYKVTSRSMNKDDEEKRINQLYIFFFDETGEYLKGGYLTGNPDAPEEGGFYAPGEGVSTLKIDKGRFNEPNNAEKAIVYAVANIDPALFPIDEETGLPKNIQSMSDLDKLVYEPDNTISLGLPKYGMPMVGKNKMNLTTPNPAGNIIELKALMARVDVNLSLESDITDHNYPALSLVEWTAKNVPVKVPFTAPADGNQTGESWEEGWTTDITTPLQRTIYNKNGVINISFYMYENVQNAEWIKNDDEDWQSEPTKVPDPEALYPKKIREDSQLAYQKQRYKPYLANKNASAIELHAFYSTYNETGSGTSTYEIRYTLYLGANHTDNFSVKRNHKYENNITIKGLTQVGTNPDHITFDARVNVKDQGNEFYIAILRERNHDAHFCVTPMDVYLFADAEKNKPSMEVILGTVPEGSETPDDASVPDWLRMEKICADDMREGTVTNSGFSDIKAGGEHLATGKGWCAGNGKRAYFTNNLLTNTLKEKGKKVALNTSRDRVYFYLDENLKLENRSAVVTLIYKENGHEVKRRTLKIEQTHFLPIDIHEVYPDNVIQGTHWGATFSRDVTIYMEANEEYLDHYDPLDEHNIDNIYEGLQWDTEGYRNTRFDDVYARYYFWVDYPLGGDKYDYATTETEPSHNWYQGLEFTNQIIDRSAQGIMNLNSKPRSAAEYCYNKNKRNNDGTVSNKKYFLPGIRQMEASLTRYYTTFPEFQTSYYWSSSVGERDGGTSGQNIERARATKVNPDGSYVPSGGQNGYYPATGYALRTEYLRIRAFRNDLKP